jgi:hypothetical protein
MERPSKLIAADEFTLSEKLMNIPSCFAGWEVN